MIDSPIGIVDRAKAYGDRVAIVDAAGEHTYADLVRSSSGWATQLLAGMGDLGEAPIAFMVAPSFRYAAVQWGIWRAGGMAVPLAVSHPAAELAYVLDDAVPHAVVLDAAYERVLAPIATERGIPVLSSGEGESSLPTVEANRRAMMLYTSGTTSRPKGVVTTHSNIEAQMQSLVEAWEWSPSDRILLTLPLHHVHGIVNVLGCALSTGATCEIMARFDAIATWERLASGELTLYMAVPTVYHRLIEAWDNAAFDVQRRWSAGVGSLRLMVSGSAALPVSVLERWEQISGHTLLERYGMTEIGMGLANPLHGERIPGSVGSPLPGVEARLVDEAGAEVADGVAGEIQIRGATVFKEYWNRPEATAAAFAPGGWFRTGDVGVRNDGIYRILGRESVDIIKTGGEKVSALEIEDVILAHDAISECAVVGIDDPAWGQRVVAAVVASHFPDDLEQWCRERLAPYKVPKQFVLVESLPRNAMGKVSKPGLIDHLLS